MLRAELKVIGGKQHGSLIPLQTKKFLVGREQDCQLRPTSESVSRHHCVFSIDDYGIRLRDLGSTNGTFVNGQRVQGQVVLQPNDRVLIGKLEFEIVIEGMAQAVHHSRVASVSSTESGTGFLLSDLAEIPESTDIGSQTMLDLGPTEILGRVSEASGETRILSADSTQVSYPIAPAVPFESPTTPELPIMLPEATQAKVPALLAATQPVAPPIPPGMPMAPQAIPTLGTQPYGMPGMMPQGYPQPQYMQAPFANYAPQYMPSPYGMPQQPFMPQQYVDPAYQQQLVYQQQLMQQQMAQQQAMMAAQYAAQPAAMEEEMPEEESSAAINSTIAPPTKLPPPEETGVKAPPPPPPAAPAVDGQAPATPQVKPNQLAADIIKKYMNRS